MKIFHNTFLWVAAYLIGAMLCIVNIAPGQTPQRVHRADTGLPFIRNYPPSEYLQHEQNWGIIRDGRGVLYSANGNGILEYDGVSWRLISTNPKSRGRSLARDAKGTIYAGASGNFGYLAPDSSGQMHFISLLTYVAEEDREFGEVWRTYCTSEGVYFQTYGKLFRWANGQIKVWKANPPFFLSYLVNDTLYISQRHTGLFKVVGDSLHLLPGSSKITEVPVYQILSYDSRTLLICAAKAGLFLFRNNTFTPFPTEADAFIRSHNLSSATGLSNNSIALGAYNGGTAIINQQGKLQMILTKESGLPTNDVKSLYYDSNNSLWLALEEGITRVKIPSRFSYFTDLQGIQGGVNSILRHQNRLYVATSQGVLYLDRQPFPEDGTIPEFKPLNANGLSYDSYALLSVEDFLLAGTNVGLFAINKQEATLISPPETVFSLHLSKHDPRIIFVGHLSGLGIVRYEQGRWRYLGKVEGITEEVRTIAEEPDGAIWLGTMNNGVLRVQMENTEITPSSAKVEHFAGDILLPDGQICLVNNRLLLVSDKGLLSLHTRSGNIFPDSTFSPALGDTSLHIFKLLEMNDGNLIADITRNGLRMIWLLKPATSSGYELDRTGFRDIALFGSLLTSFIDSDNTVWIGTTKGLIRYDPTIPQNIAVQFPPLIRRISTINGDSLIFGGTRSHQIDPPVLSYRDNAIQFKFAVPSLDYVTENQYQYMLEGFDAGWSEWVSETRKDYTNLPAGAYTFRVRARNIFHQVSDEALFSLQIKPPWHRSWWAYLIYVLLAGGVVFGLVKTRVRQLQARTRQLEALVEERTVTIRQQAEKLQEMDHLKSRFFANISHEFRTPLTLILGPLADLLAQTRDTAAATELKIMQRSARRLLLLINQLLDLSRLESGRMVLRAARGDLVSFLRGIVMAFASLAEQKGVDLRFKLSPQWEAAPSQEIYFDRDKIEKIFFNLLSNAFKFTPEGGSVIVDCGFEIADSTISDLGLRIADLKEQNKSEIRNPKSEISEFVEIRVSDSGSGIPAKHLPHIFDRFFQIDDSTGREHSGTGIGLALTRELVELHHGEILVQSEVGKGTTFIVRLPIGKEHLQAGEIADPPISDLREGDAIASPDPDLPDSILEIKTSDTPVIETSKIEKSAIPNPQSQMILIVDDHPDVRYYLRKQLEAEYEITEAADGGEGLESALEIIPDLVISDVMMPGMNGQELCKALKTNDKTSHIPVILLTARAGEQDKLAGLETGADDYLIKPFNSQELQIRVHNLIEIRRKLQEHFRKEGLLAPRDLPVTSIEQAFLEKLREVLEQHLAEEDFGIDTLCRELAMSPRQLQRKIRALTDESPTDLIRSARLERAKYLLEQHTGTVSEIAFAVGFNNLSYFARTFRERFGVSPSRFSKHSGQ